MITTSEATPRSNSNIPQLVEVALQPMIHLTQSLEEDKIAQQLSALEAISQTLKRRIDEKSMGD